MSFKIKAFSILLLIICLLALSFLWISRPIEGTDIVDIYNPQYYIAHGGGGINGAIYTNSKEAVVNSLNNGFNYIELDLQVTADGDVVCVHDLGKFNMITRENYKLLSTSSFKRSKIFSQFTPITLNEAIAIWKQHPFFFVTDKVSNPEILGKYFISNRDQVIVETRSAIEYRKLKGMGFVPMLSMGKNLAGLLRYVYTSIVNMGIVQTVVMPAEQNPRFFRFYKRMGSKVAVYMRNENRTFFEEHLGNDIDQVYTDFWIPQKSHFYNR